MTTIAAAIKTWEELWRQGCRVFTRFGTGERREALQLTLGALLYQRWALDRLDERVFHLHIRDNPMTMEELVAGDPLTDRHHVGATMHLASASIRLPAALHQVAKILRKEAEFDGLYGSEDWPRARACRYLDEVRRLEHCSTGLTIPVALVVLLLFRDEFGHGEEGSGEDHWRRDRGTTMAGLYRCQTVEAQQRLARWAFDMTERT
jgi:hypothetical protein